MSPGLRGPCRAAPPEHVAPPISAAAQAGWARTVLRLARGDRRRIGPLEGGGKQVAGRQAAVGPPFLGDGEDLLLGGEVAELIGGPDGLAERKVARQDHVFPAERSLPESTPSSSVGEGRWPPNRTAIRARVRRVAGTESCCPVTWNSRAPYRSIGGSRAIHARGSKAGRSSMSRASTGSALRR